MFDNAKELSFLTFEDIFSSLQNDLAFSVSAVEK